MWRQARRRGQEYQDVQDREAAWPEDSEVPRRHPKSIFKMAFAQASTIEREMPVPSPRTLADLHPHGLNTNLFFSVEPSIEDSGESDLEPSPMTSPRRAMPESLSARRGPSNGVDDEEGSRVQVPPLWERCREWQKEVESRKAVTRSKLDSELTFTPRRIASDRSDRSVCSHNDSQLSGSSRFEMLVQAGKEKEERLKAKIAKIERERSKRFSPQLTPRSQRYDVGSLPVEERSMKWKIQHQQKLDELRGESDPGKLYPFAPATRDCNPATPKTHSNDAFLERMEQHSANKEEKLEKIRRDKKKKHDADIWEKCSFKPSIIPTSTELGAFESRNRDWHAWQQNKLKAVQTEATFDFKPQSIAHPPRGFVDAGKTKEFMKQKWANHKVELEEERANAESVMKMHTVAKDLKCAKDRVKESVDRLAKADVETRRVKHSTNCAEAARHDESLSSPRCVGPDSEKRKVARMVSLYEDHLRRMADFNKMNETIVPPDERATHKQPQPVWK